jgi:hypothetical protein
MTDRDDSNLRHYNSRCFQPKILAYHSVANASCRAPAPGFHKCEYDGVNDYGPLNTADDRDIKFKYVGVPISPHTQELSKRGLHQGLMRDNYRETHH